MSMNLRSLVPFGDRDSIVRPGTKLIGTLHHEIDRLFDEFAGARGRRSLSVAPSLDVVETDKEIEITAELPGLERQDVEISLEDDVLTIRGEKKIEMRPEQTNGDKNFHITERSYGMFYRMLQLPTHVDPSTVQATMSKGVLKITIPKPAQSEARKIEIKEAA